MAEGISPFRPGMSASVQIQTTKVEDVMALPLSAITSRSDLSQEGGKVYVFTYDRTTQTVTAVPVKTGIQDMANIEIKEGLTDSTVVVTGPFSAISKTLHNGSKVKVSATK